MLTKPTLVEISDTDGLLQYLSKMTQEINRLAEKFSNLVAELDGIKKPVQSLLLQHSAEANLQSNEPKQKRRTKT